MASKSQSSVASYSKSKEDQNVLKGKAVKLEQEGQVVSEKEQAPGGSAEVKKAKKKENANEPIIEQTESVSNAPDFGHRPEEQKPKYRKKQQEK